MSIYSGFPTRQLQSTYNSHLQDLIYVLQKRIIKFYIKEATDEQKFLQIIQVIYEKMRKMQAYKYLEPKLSNSYQELYYMLSGKCKSNQKKCASRFKSRNISHQSYNPKMRGVTSDPDSKGKDQELFANPQKITQNYRKSSQHIVGRIRHQGDAIKISNISSPSRQISSSYGSNYLQQNGHSQPHRHHFHQQQPQSQYQGQLQFQKSKQTRPQIQINVLLNGNDYVASNNPQITNSNKTYINKLRNNAKKKMGVQ